MKLIACHIDNFGKLQNFDCRFDSRLMVIPEDNGWGKSTFAAFLRIMFYGFAGSSRRGKTDSERSRFRPWQQGPYGGTLTFETEGRVYRIERTFGDRPREDTFLLYDEETGLLSGDFSQKIGEELFKIDHESFLRTLYIGQLDCPTDSTAGIQAIMGGSDAADDLVRYEGVRSRLQKEADRLSPDRPAGRISRRQGDLQALRSRKASLEDLDQACTAAAEKLDRENEEIVRLEYAQKEIQSLLEKKADITSPGGVMEQYAMLLGAQDAAAAEEEKVLSFFPEEIPAPDDPRLDALIRARESREKTSASLAEIRTAVHQRQDTLQDLSVTISSLEEAHPALVPSSGKKGAERTEEGTSPGLWLLIAGMALLVASFIGPLNVKRTYAIAMALGGLVLAGTGSLMMVRILRIRKRVRLSEKELRFQEKLQGLRGRQQMLERSIRDLTEQEEETVNRLLEIDRETEDYLAELGFIPEEDPAAQLVRIRSQAEAAARMGRQTRMAAAAREEFEKAHGLNADMVGKTREEDEGPSMADLTRQLRQVTADLEMYRSSAEEDSHSLQILRGQLSQAREASREYEKGCRELESLQHRYRVLERTLWFLEQARNSFQARHKDTFLEAFRIYYEYLSGESAEAFETDASLSIRLRDQGLPRETGLLSAGCQDLIGLCRRLAMIDTMYRGEKPFLIMDDPFVSLDQDRLQAGLKLVRGLSEGRQVIYFTCHPSRIPQ